MIGSVSVPIAAAQSHSVACVGDCRLMSDVLIHFLTHALLPIVMLIIYSLCAFSAYKNKQKYECTAWLCCCILVLRFFFD